MRSVFISTIFVLVFSAAAFSQTNEISPCPKFNTLGPAGPPESGETVTFTVYTDNNNDKLNEYVYNWTVSSGTIIEGQEKNIIRVVTSKEASSLWATVEIKGLTEGCPNKFTEQVVVSVSATCGLPIELDEYGNISLNDEKARLSVVADELRKNENSIALFIFYSAEKDTPQTLKNRMSRIANYLT